MPLEKGWLATTISNLVFRPLTGQVQEAAEKYGVNISDLLPPEEMPGVAPADVITRVLSYTGGILGSPLGLLPALMLIYQAGRGQEHIQDANRAFLPNKIPPETFARLLFRGEINETNIGQWLDDMRALGWSQDRVDALVNSYRIVLNLGEVRDCYLRGMFGEGEEATSEAKRRITMLGVDEGDADKIFQLFFYLPTPGEVMRWAAREVFEPELREKYRLDENLPPDFLDWAAKVGITGEVARNFWAAHWELPAYNAVVEMWHRGVIGEDDVDSFFTQLDMNPYWRDKLKEVSYTPLTRVDVRRMYKLGVLSDEEVYQAYLDIHYSPENALRMLEFTKKYYPAEDTSDNREVRELTKSEILGAYEKRIIKADDTLAGLKSIDYDENTAMFLMAVRDYKVKEKELKETLDYIKDAYRYGIITDYDMIDQLGKLNLSGEEQDLYVEEFRRAKSLKVVRPSKSDFKRWFKRDIISETDYRAELENEGYLPEYIENYIEEVKATPAREITSE